MRGSGQKIANRPLWSKLTAREQEVMSMVKTGLSYMDLAERYNTSPETIKKHIGNVCDKLGCYNKTQIIVMLLEEKHASELDELRTEFAIPVS